MSVKDVAEDVKKQAEELKKEARETLGIVTEMIPRPLKHRKTVLLRKPLVERLVEGRLKRRRTHKTY